MKTITVVPLSDLESQRALGKRDLIRAYATVLLWATDAGAVAVTYSPQDNPSFQFENVHGEISYECKNVTEPPSCLKGSMARSILNAMSGNVLVYLVNRVLVAWFGSSRTALLEILTSAGSVKWKIAYKNDFVTSVWQSGTLDG